MQTFRFLGTTAKDGTLALTVPKGQPDTEYEVLVVVQPRTPETTPDERGWPPGFLERTFGSITDETFKRPPQGKLPKPVNLD